MQKELTVNSKIKELFSNTLLFGIANMGSKIMVFLMIPLYTSVLTTVEYGISDMVLTTASMLFPILTAKIAEAVLRFCYLKQYSTKDVFSIGVRISLFGTIICFLLSAFFLFVPFFHSLSYYVLFIPVLFVCESLIELLHKYCRGVGMVKISATAGLLSTAIIILSNIIFLLFLKIGVFGYLLSFVIGQGLAVIYMAIKCGAVNVYTTTKHAFLKKEMLKYSIPLVPNSLSWWTLSNFNRYLILSWLGVSAVGIYSATLRIPSILTALCDIFSQAWLLSALKDYGSKESKRFIHSVHNKFFSFFILVTALIILFSYPISVILLSGDFCMYWWVTPYLFISVFWGAIVNFLGSIFSSERKNTMQFVSTMIGATVSIVITILFLKHYGLVIVAISTMVGYYVIWLIRRLAVNKYINIGYSTIFSSLQGAVLVAEAIFVSRGMYVFAVTCVLILFTTNYKELLRIIKFCFLTINIVIKKYV